MIFSKAFSDFMCTGKMPTEEIVEDAMPKGNDGKSIDLQRHDAKFHGGHYDGKGSCKYREALAKGDNADDLSKAERDEEKASGAAAATPQDYDDLEDIRQKVEASARLLNGRAGNLQALQASRRWGLLDSISGDPQIAADLAKFVKSSDPAISGQAKDLEQILFDIAAQKKLGWKQGVGMVPPPLAAPQSAGTQTPSAGATTGGTQPGKFSADDAKAVLGRVAKSINYHIDQGDFTPNAGAIAKYQAAKADIAALNDPQLDQFCQEIDASLAAGNQKKVSKVPAPSQAWQQAHAPKMPAGGLGGLLGALLGGMGGMGGGAPSAPAVKGKFSGQTWTPFSAPSPWAAQIQAANANHPAATDPNWFKDQADKLTPQQAVADMESRGDIVKGGYRDTIDQNDPDELALWGGPHNPFTGWWNPSKRLSADTARCASVCFGDLRKRFPNMPWKSNLELRCGEHTGSTAGQSVHTADDSRHSVLFGCDYNSNLFVNVGLGKDNYGHNDNRLPFDVLRHEMGHSLISGHLPDGRRMISKWHDAVTKAYGNPAKDLEAFAAKYVSSYAVYKKDGVHFSMAECLSECFSLATSPDYQPGYLPPPVEDFIFGEMLGVK